MKHMILAGLILISFIAQAQNKWSFGFAGGINSGGLPFWKSDLPDSYELEQTGYTPLLAPYAGISFEYKARPHFSLHSDLIYLVMGGTEYSSRELRSNNLYKTETWTEFRFQNIELPFYFSSAFHTKKINWEFEYGYELSYAISGKFTQNTIYADYADIYGDELIKTEEIKINAFEGEGYETPATRVNHLIFVGLSAELIEKLKLNLRISSGNYFLAFANCYDSGSWCVTCEGYSYHKMNYTLGLRYSILN